MEFLARVRLAYLQGWVESGGPMTDRVKAGCTAALAMARDDPDDPGVFEVTLHTGRLEGYWARIFADREDVHTHHQKQITRAYRALLDATIDIPAAVAAFRTQLATDPDVATAAKLAARKLIHAAVDPALPEYRAVIDAITAALIEAANTGWDAGMMLIGAHEAAPPTDPDPDADNKHRQEAGSLLLVMLRGSITDAERSFTAAANDAQADADDEPDGGDGSGEPDDPEPGGVDTADADPLGGLSDDEIADTISAGFADVRAAAYYADLGIGQSFMDAMASVFSLSGVTQCNWISAGDSRVCSVCLGYETAGPYAPDAVPAVPHGGCRCVIEPG